MDDEFDQSVDPGEDEADQVETSVIDPWKPYRPDRSSEPIRVETVPVPSPIPPPRGVYPSELITARPAPPRRWPLAVGAFLAAFVGALTAVGVLAAFGLLAGDDAEPADAAPPVTVVERVVREIVPQAEPVDTAQAVWLKVGPSVVRVEVGRMSSGECIVFGSGSGVVLDREGRIATNHHVVEGSDCQTVIFEDGVTYEARLLGSDDVTDVAVLDIDGDDLQPIEFGTGGDIAIGQTAIAVGNPLGQIGGASLTVGVLSALDREVDFGDGSALFGMLQTDAPITQGSSGGALVDEEGRLIGITTAIGVSDAGAEGIGYAIPIELVTRITEEIIETGEVRHAFLGITGSDHVVERTDGGTAPAGAEVQTVIEGTAAAELGLAPGDVIVALDGDPITTMNDLVISLRLYRAGTEVTFTVDSGGERSQRSVALGELTEDVDG